MYTPRTPLITCVRELNLSAVAIRALPFALHVPGASNLVAGRLSRGFNGPHSLRALRLEPQTRRRSDWARPSCWHVPQMTGVNA